MPVKTVVTAVLSGSAKQKELNIKTSHLGVDESER
jgi:hypothetical protein